MIYNAFSDYFCYNIKYFINEFKLNTSIDDIIAKMGEIIKKNSLHEIIKMILTL